MTRNEAGIIVAPGYWRDVRRELWMMLFGEDRPRFEELFDAHHKASQMEIRCRALWGEEPRVRP